MITRMRFRQEKAEDVVEVLFRSRYYTTANA